MRAKTVGLIAHPRKPGVGEMVRKLADEFKRAGIEVKLEEATGATAGFDGGLPIKDVGRACDLLVVLGGDGTILDAVGRLGDDLKPVFGINIGSLGFLTCLNSAAYKEGVAAIAAGAISLSERTLLEVQCENAPVGTGLNDVVFSRGEVSRLVRLLVSVNGEPLTEFSADGLIVATPTGSTAYSLSAGGPIMSPDSGVLVITPICPHVLTNRSLIIPEDAVIEARVTEREYPVFLTVDGRAPVAVESGQAVTIRRAARRLSLAALPENTFFSVVRQKLKWRGSNI